MTTAESTTAAPAHPRDRSMESWRARLGVLASRGETDGPRVDEARAALSWWRVRSTLMRELDLTEDRAESLLEVVWEPPDTERADAATDAEAVAR